MILSKLLTYKLFESNKPSILLDEDDIKEYFIDLIDEGYEIDKISVMYGDRNGESWSKSNFPKVGYIPYYELKLKVNREKGGMHYMKSPKDIKTKINIYNILYNCAAHFESGKNLKFLGIEDEYNNFILRFSQDIEIPSEEIPNPIVESIKHSLKYCINNNQYYYHYIESGIITIETIDKSENVDGLEINIKVKSTPFGKIIKLFLFELRNWEYKLTYKNRQQGNYKILAN